MLRITVLGEEFFNEETSEIVILGGFNLELEHSLVSLSKWESEFEKPFLVDDEKTPEEIFGYIKAMTLNSDVPPEVWASLTNEHLKTIQEYMNKKSSATWFNEVNKTTGSSRVITSELIYYWLSGFGISFHPVETWHLNRLFTLLKVVSLESQKKKPMSREQRLAQQRELNMKRRAQYGTSG